MWVWFICRRCMCGCRNHGVIILIKLTNFHPFYIMNLILSNQKTSRCVFKMMKKRSVIVPGRRNARESARGDGKEGSLVPVPYGARESVGCRRENLGTRLKCSVCRRLLLPLLHAEKGRSPFSACNTGNRIRLHAGKSSTKFFDGIVTLSKWHWKIIWFAPLLSEGLLSLGLGSFRRYGMWFELISVQRK